MAQSISKPVDWTTIRNYRPDDFSRPMDLDDSVVRGLDYLADRLYSKAVILSDVRATSAFDDSQHPKGRAIDFTYPNLDSNLVLDQIFFTKAFGGVGMYVNEAGIVSFHVDTRTDRSPEQPATWGATKGKSADGWIYTSLRSISDFVQANPTGLGIVTILGLLALAFAVQSSK